MTDLQKLKTIRSVNRLLRKELTRLMTENCVLRSRMARAELLASFSHTMKRRTR